MKIKHVRNKRLLEAVDDEEVINVDQSTDDLAKDITDAYAQGAGVVIPEENADNTAKELKDAAKGIKTEVIYAPIVAKNRITEVLDFALADASMDMAAGIRPSANILIDGLPGSGKTAIVGDWAEARGCHLVYVNAKNKDLDAFLNGYPIPVDNPNARSKKSVDQAYSSAIDELDEDNSILFLDEFNRAPSDIRASLLTLINEHKVAGDNKGYRYFKKLLFSVACINPSIPTDEGAMPLNDAEKSRFTPGLSILYDSNTKDALAYVRLRYKQRIEKIPKDLPKQTRELMYRKWSCAEDMLLFILSDRTFSFDDRKMDTLNDLAKQDATMLNQRSLIEAIEKYAYKGKQFVIQMLELDVTDTADLHAKAFSNAKREMLLKILNKYQDPQVKIPDDFHDGVEAEEDPTYVVDGDSQGSGGGGKGGDMEEVDAGSLGKQDVYGVGDLDDIDLSGGIEIDDSMFASITGGKQPAVSEAEAKKRISEFDFS